VNRRLPFGMVPYAGPPVDLRGTVLTVRRFTCENCGALHEVVVVLTDRNEIAVLSGDEADRLLTS
jgi:hypothetical protein